MKAEGLAEADGGRKNQGSGKCESERAVVDLLLPLVVGSEEPKQKQDRCPACDNGQREHWNVERWNLADDTDCYCRKYRSDIKEQERTSAAVG